MGGFAKIRAAPRRLPVQIGLFGLVYFGCARAGLAFGDETGITPIWAANGVLLGVLLAVPRRNWPALVATAYAADLGANLAAGVGLTSAGIALGDMVEALLAATLIALIAAGPFSLSRIRCVVALTVAAVAATAVAALLGTSAVTLASGGSFSHTWLLWWSADAIGLLAVTPVVWTVLSRSAVGFSRGRLAETLVAFAMLVGITVAVFSIRHGEASQAQILPPVLLIPFLLWIAWRSGPAAAAVSSLVVSAVAALFTVDGLGPFAAVAGSQAEDLFSLQMFIGVTVATGLATAAAVTEARAVEAALVTAERRFRTLVEQVPTVTYICDYDENATPLYMSPQFETLTGHSAARWLADPDYWKQVVHPEDRDWVVERIARGVREEVPFDAEYRMVRADGETIVVWDRETIVRDDEDRPIMSQGVLLDVTELRRAEAALAESEELHRSTVEALEEGVFVLDADGTVVACNSSGAAAMGSRPEELIGKPPPFDRAYFPDGTPLDETNSPALQALRTGVGLRDVELRLAGPNDEERWVRVNYQPLQSQEGGSRGLVWSFIDVTDRRESEARIAYLAYNDALTGLPNRAALEQAVGPALARANRNDRAAALIYFDLDHFKVVNDSLGHAAGDELLRRVTERLRARVREGEMLVRLGGDEFMLMIPDLGANAADVAWQVANDFIAQLEEPFAIGGSEFEVSASAGIALYPRHGEHATELLKHADAALYEIKRNERGSVAFYEPSGSDPTHRLTLSSEVRRALANDEFELHYQPVFALDNIQPIGVEALIRWRHPVRGLVPPIDFIPIAEETGLIELIGDWVVDAVLKQGEAWMELGLRPMLGFNVSPRQLRRRGFAADLARRVSSSRIPPWQISVEITESATAGAPEHTEAVLTELHEFGLQLALDDFGADFSSLDRLRSLPVDMLKIDRSFLVGVPEAPDATAVIKAIVQLAAALEMRAVAEGIETQEQVEFMLGENCAFGQGYHLSPPLPVDEITALLLRASSTRNGGRHRNGHGAGRTGGARTRVAQPKS